MDFFIGPCVLESWDLIDEVAGYLTENLDTDKLGINLTIKGSFDKANRSSIDSYRGPGIEKGLKFLERIKDKYKLPVITDFHMPSQAMEVASVVDTLQIPAFLCRQTDMIVAGAQACAKHGGRLKIKKGQFLSPYDTKNIVDKATNYLSKESILLTERGTSFGYNNLVVDMASFQVMKSFGVKTVHDATHCVQQPGGLGATTGGKRDQIHVLAKAAIAAGADAIFMEAHPNPSKALSDATSQLELTQVPAFIESLMKVKKAVS